MNRLIWGVGVAGLALAALTSVLLRRPVEPSFTEVSTATESARAPRLNEAAPPPRPALPVSAAEPTRPPDTDTPSALDTTGREPAPSVRARRPPSEPRQRVVQALRAAASGPAARREAVLASLAASGESHAPWTQQAREALDLWRQQVATSVLPIQSPEAPRCFAAGCVSRVTFPDAASYEAAFRLTPELRLPGGSAHLQLPAEHLASGEVSAAWVVLPPDVP
ncbi:hypothetical protein HUW62_19830 [Myxococcus sp. AM011]|uniref:hypothetical protein n=1 Tax=Myxococcus sp. AM011 TaxID=2745200 RepID=UPI001595D16D|nr:hypothetical protein [Myxococcus sp. AM011]NVJ23478.1 hypothetical protein [Myxococcus sp. AM011]